MVLLTLIRNTGKRIPLIKFRKGGASLIADQHLSSADTAGAPVPSSKGAATQLKRHTHSQAIEDWELPQRYRRRLIDERECDYINRGGPE